VSAIDLHGCEFVGPGAHQKGLLARKRVNHLPRILVGFEERSVYARIAEFDDCRWGRRRLSLYVREEYNHYKSDETNSAERWIAVLNYAVFLDRHLKPSVLDSLNRELLAEAQLEEI
jgi:hypothetical protein